ncbi:MAG: hypothetical protein INR71_05660 [Terriglobus roseus]|nr:hypothetical protein [Terriglobus roseus]
MIETPTVDYIPVTALDNLDDSSKSTSPILINGEAHIVEKNRPITSKIRTTLRHLTAHAGWSARWRGLGYGIVYTGCNGVVYAFVSGVLFWLPGAQVFAAIVAAVATAPIHCAWTHKMIAVKSAKGPRARLPGRGVWRQLWIPNVVASASCQASMMLVALLTVVLARGSVDLGNDSTPPQFNDGFVAVVLKIFAVLALSFFLAFFVVLPNYAALTRIEATLLPDDEDTIVPFDRTFGGMVTPVVVGGSGFSYVKEVCRTFDGEARARIMKLFFKGMAIAFALIIAYVHIIAFEIFLVIGPAAHRAAKDAGARMN